MPPRMALTQAMRVAERTCRVADQVITDPRSPEMLHRGRASVRLKEFMVEWSWVRLRREEVPDRAPPFCVLAKQGTLLRNFFAFPLR
jgi:hypothetical protein